MKNFKDFPNVLKKKTRTGKARARFFHKRKVALKTIFNFAPLSNAQKSDSFKERKGVETFSFKKGNCTLRKEIAWA